jgi:hypothetical protein
MTVAAVILSATADGAVADTLGQPRVRRLVDIAWSGGAMPVIVVAPDPDGAVARALVGSEAIHEETAPVERGPAGQMAHGAARAGAEVRGTSAVLLWPARFSWIGPETVTSLIETHGTDPLTILRPTWQEGPGWPILVPTAHLASLDEIGPDAFPAEIADLLADRHPTRLVELGDPGVAIDVETAFDALPAYEGPPDPPHGHVHEWGDGVAAEAGLADPDDTA